jgi:hypothetical protein
VFLRYYEFLHLKTEVKSISKTPCFLNNVKKRTSEESQICGLSILSRRHQISSTVIQRWTLLKLSYSQSFPLLPTGSRCRGCLFSLDHTQTHTTVGRSPLDEGSARRRDLYLTTQTLYKTNIHVPGGIRTHDPSMRSAADLRLRRRGHWDQLRNLYHS